MRRYKIYFPTIIYFGKRFLVCGALLVLYMVFFPFKEIVLNVYKTFNLKNLLLFSSFVVVIVLFLKSFIRFVKPFWYIWKVFEHENEVLDKGRVVTLDGEPGSGKTLTMTYDSLLLADSSFIELQFKYYLQFGREKMPELKPFNTIEDYWRHIAVTQTINYYDMHPEVIPLLVSNFPVWRDGQFSSVLNFAHYLQNERLPEGAVLVQDESADVLSNQRSKAGLNSDIAVENEVINETVSKERHFGDWFLLFAEQDSAENYIGVRRVVSMNRYLRSLTKVCLPDWYIKRFEKLKQKIIFAKDCSAKQYKKITSLKRKIDKIGFFRISYEETSNKEKSKAKAEDGYFALPINLPFKYETRAYFFDYSALLKPLQLKTHTSMYVDVTSKKK